MRNKTKRCKICNQEIGIDDGYLCSTCRQIEDEVKFLEKVLNIIFPVSIKTARKIKLNWQYKK